MKKLLAIAILLVTLSVGCSPLLTINNSGEVSGTQATGAAGIVLNM